MSTTDITTADFVDTIAKGTVVIDFWATWCPPCRLFAPVFDAASAKHPEVTFGKVDTEAEPDLAAALHIRSIPTLMVFRDGILVYRDAGALPAAALEALIQRVGELDMDAVRRKLDAVKAQQQKAAAS